LKGEIWFFQSHPCPLAPLEGKENRKMWGSRRKSASNPHAPNERSGISKKSTDFRKAMRGKRKVVRGRFDLTKCQILYII
jgi:hypothetical protein